MDVGICGKLVSLNVGCPVSRRLMAFRKSLPCFQGGGPHHSQHILVARPGGPAFRCGHQIRAMSQYHRNTAYFREQIGGYALDWSQQPHPFKKYLHRQTLGLPDPRPPREPFFAHALGWPPPVSEINREFDAGDLAAVLLMSAGVTAKSTVSLRAPASAGALYPAELYALCCGTGGIKDGLYHFAPKEPGLHRLRSGPLSAAMAKLAGGEAHGLWFAISAIFWRSLWKYRTRALRYCLLDAGHLLANLELSLAVCGLSARTVFDFPDSSLGVFLGLASEEEAPLVLVGAGPKPVDPGPEDPGLPPLDLQAAPLSQRVGRDKDLLCAHQKANLESEEDKPAPFSHRPPPPIPPLPDPGPPEADPPFLEVVRTRRSRRNFLARPLDMDRLLLLLRAALPARTVCRASLVIGPGPDWQPGVYHYHPAQAVLEPVSTGEDLRGRAARACLGQMWVGQAAMSLLFWADLDCLEDRAGPRAYRRAMLQAGRAGQRLYLAANALGLGSCGVGAFYDQELCQAAALPAKRLAPLSGGRRCGEGFSRPERPRRLLTAPHPLQQPRSSDS